MVRHTHFRFNDLPGGSAPPKQWWRSIVASVAALAVLGVGVAAVPPAAQANGCGNTGDFAGGTGTVADPYLVSTPAQLQAMATEANLTCAYLVTNDLDLSSQSPWTPIGRETTFSDTTPQEFRGSFDGGGFTISGLNVNNTTNAWRGWGLFGWVTEASLTNVVIDGATVFSARPNSTSAASVGALAGRALSSTISNIEITGVVRLTAANEIGGAVGVGFGINLTNVLIDADLVITLVNDGREDLGGAVGWMTFTGDTPSNASNVTVTGVTIQMDATTNTGTNRVEGTGGLVGDLGPGSVLTASHARNTTITTAGTQRRLDKSGGAIGVVGSSVTMEQISATSVSITGNGSEEEALGGLIGQLSAGSDGSRVRWSYASGTVGSAEDIEVGGLIGEAFDNALVEDSYANVDVAGASATAALVGRIEVSGFNPGEARFTTIRRSYASGAVVGTGGMVGAVDTSGDSAEPPVAEASFWDTTTSGQATSADDLGTGLPTTEMQTLATFADDGWAIIEGWEPFNPAGARVWGICADYPFLLWEYSAAVDVSQCAPPPPVALTPQLSGTDVTFSWEPGEGQAATSYRVALSPGGAACEVTAPTTTCGIGGLEPGTTYTAVATATNDFGTSGPSTAVEFTPSASPTPTPTTTPPPEPTPTTTPAPAPDGPGTGNLPQTGSPSWAVGVLLIGLALLLAGLGVLGAQRTFRRTN